ncbi:D-alanyl-D-alanine carboxypeptidase family protein [Aureimonas sp. AU12]|uniref:D-alanyl-D-alanine carboxypeptidase family protein n=1 Tax=Aureimonas sp. AU12 TaxID=1638161 RepID=UPI0007812B48|nr:D-alanyl-D-alanine carboxypeptidase family protein [Aureimonas sp. AU12]
MTSKRHVASTMAHVGLLWLAALMIAAPASAADDKAPFAIETVAGQALILDIETGSILLEKDVDQPFPPASLAKLMTAEVVFDALKRGEISPATAYPVTNHAWRTGGAPSGTSTMFAAVRSDVPVEALVRGLVVQAANDGAIVLAEGLSGSEEAFAGRMNERARELGLTASRFVNPTGLPADGQSVTARDMAQLARHMAADAQWYPLYAEPQFEWNKILQRNRNPLLRLDIGATGMASGFTRDVGYSIVGVTDRGGRRTVLVLAGLETDAIRTKETERLANWTQDNFERRRLFTGGETVGFADVFGGLSQSVPLVLQDDLVAYVPADRTLTAAAVVYDGPLRAPIGKGAKIGTLEIKVDGKTNLRRDLFAAEDVVEGTFSMKALDAARELAFGWIRSL